MSLLSLDANTMRKVMNYEGQMVHVGRIVLPVTFSQLGLGLETLANPNGGGANPNPNGGDIALTGYAMLGLETLHRSEYKNVLKNGKTAPKRGVVDKLTRTNINRLIADLKNRYYDLSTQYKVDKNREIIDLFARDPKRDKTFSSLALTAKAFQNAKRARVRVAPIMFSRPFKNATYHKTVAESKRHRNAANKAATNLQQKYNQEYINFYKKHHNTPYYRSVVKMLEENLRVERNQTSKRSSSRNTKPGKRARLERSHGRPR